VHYVHQYNQQGLITVGEICRRLGVGQTTVGLLSK
jgi:phage antirepressor YoqD-like protein